MKLYYYEPWEDGDRVIETTAEEAIRVTRAACVQARGEDLYPDDRTALQDFILNNWVFKAILSDGTKINPLRDGLPD